MAFSTLITITLAGSDTGPFNLYSNIDGYTVPFETNVPKLDLEAGYLSVLVPDTTTTIRVQSMSVLCSNYYDAVISGITTTTTSTTTSTTSTTTTTTTIAFESFSVVYGNSLGAVCAEPTNTVYTASGGTIFTGNIVYTDSALTSPLLGYDYISEGVSFEIYNVNALTGEIGAGTGNFC